MPNPTIETAIWKALRARMESLSLTPAATIIWPADVTPLPDGTSVEVTHLPNRPQRRYLADADPSYRQGILQAGVMTKPQSNPEHLSVATEIAGRIAEHFPSGLRMTFQGIVVRVSEAPAIGSGFHDLKRMRWVTPVSIRYHTEA
jgi:hypothetical protein